MTPAFYCILFLDGLFLKYVVNRIVFGFNIYGVVILIEESLSALVCGCFFDVGIFIVIFDWEFVTVLEEVLEMSVESDGETDFGVILKFIDLYKLIFVLCEWVFEWVLIEEGEADGSIVLTVLIVFVEIELNGLIFIGVDELWVLLLSGDDKVRLLRGGDKVHFLLL